MRFHNRDIAREIGLDSQGQGRADALIPEIDQATCCRGHRFTFRWVSDAAPCRGEIWPAQFPTPVRRVGAAIPPIITKLAPEPAPIP
jgi:hypothetical protein